LPTVGDRYKIPGQLEQQALLGSWFGGFSLGVHVFVEEADFDPEGLRETIAHGETVIDRERNRSESLVERSALEPLHREVHAPVVERTVRDVTNDGGIGELGEELGLAREASVGEVRLDERERDEAVGLPVPRAEHRPHAALSGDAIDLEAIGDDDHRRSASTAEEESEDERESVTFDIGALF
jgi:hypothetical protein